MKQHKKAGPFRYPEQVPERYKWTSAAIDEFLKTKYRRNFRCLGDGNVEIIVTSFEVERIPNNEMVTVHVDRTKVTVYDYTGLTRYVGFKDD